MVRCHMVRSPFIGLRNFLANRCRELSAKSTGQQERSVNTILAALQTNDMARACVAFSNAAHLDPTDATAYS